jgi:F-type H+-transporting ATPase subunit b
MKLDPWTFVLQAVNATVLIWLLKRFFWGPLSAMIAQRREMAAAALAEAEAKRAEATAAAEEAARVRTGFAAERQTVLAAAREEAAKEHEIALAAAAAEAEGLRAAARQDIAAERAAAVALWRAEAAHLAVDIAGRLAARLSGAAVQETFRAWLEKALRDVPAAARPSSGMLRLTSASALDDAEQGRCRALVGTVLGQGIAVEFAVDPALIGGLELEGGGLSVRNSWRADLERIGAEIGRER